MSDPGGMSLGDSPQLYPNKGQKGSLPKLGQILKPGLDRSYRGSKKQKKSSNGGLMI